MGFKPAKQPEEKDKMIVLYADGAHRGSSDASAYSFYLQYQALERLEGFAVWGETNNAMEITAVLEGLRAIRTPKIPVKVYSDSKYVVDCFNQSWYKGWERNGWKNSKKEPVKNANLWRELIQETKRFSFLTFAWVKGHGENDFNNLVDKKNNEVMDELERGSK